MKYRPSRDAMVPRWCWSSVRAVRNVRQGNAQRGRRSRTDPFFRGLVRSASGSTRRGQWPVKVPPSTFASFCLPLPLVVLGHLFAWCSGFTLLASSPIQLTVSRDPNFLRTVVSSKKERSLTRFDGIDDDKRLRFFQEYYEFKVNPNRLKFIYIYWRRWLFIFMNHGYFLSRFKIKFDNILFLKR